jgi:hypothetical protein
VTDADATGGTFTGTGLGLHVAYAGGTYTVTVTDIGTGFEVGQTLVFPGTLFGGSSPTNDLTVTVATLAEFGPNAQTAQYLLLQKLVNVRAALAEIDANWEDMWDAQSNDLTNYTDVPDEVVAIGDLIDANDFDSAKVYAVTTDQEDATNADIQDTLN